MMPRKKFDGAAGALLLLSLPMDKEDNLWKVVPHFTVAPLFPRGLDDV
jgi:hypothetical protein